MTLRQRFSSFIKWITIFFAFGGTILGLFTAKLDGYSHWTKRLLYFTTQSNVWVGIIFLSVVILNLLNVKPDNSIKETFYYCKYIFTVSIAMTGVVFCCFLGPFADSSYRPWSFYSIIVHAITPFLAVIDFYVDEYEINFSRQHVLATLIVPLIYYSLAIFLCAFNLDFGRGDPFPYFFLDLNSNVGIFGFTKTPFPNMGTFWWILFFSIIMLIIAYTLARTKRLTIPSRLNKTLT